MTDKGMVIKGRHWTRILFVNRVRLSSKKGNYKIMKEIINRIEPKYIIIRRNGEGKEYFSGANIYRRDNDGVLRVSKTKWSKIFNPMSATYSLDRMKDILDGMRKYGEIEEGYNYVIAKIYTTTTIVNYIEQEWNLNMWDLEKTVENTVYLMI